MKREGFEVTVIVSDPICNGMDIKNRGFHRNTTGRERARQWSTASCCGQNAVNKVLISPPARKQHFAPAGGSNDVAST